MSPGAVSGIRAPSVTLGSRLGSLLIWSRGVEHRFQPVDPVLPLDVAAGHSAGTLRVHREQPPRVTSPSIRMEWGVHLWPRAAARQRAQEHLQHAAGGTSSKSGRGATSPAGPCCSSGCWRRWRGRWRARRGSGSLG